VDFLKKKKNYNANCTKILKEFTCIHNSLEHTVSLIEEVQDSYYELKAYERALAAEKLHEQRNKSEKAKRKLKQRDNARLKKAKEIQKEKEEHVSRRNKAINSSLHR